MMEQIYLETSIFGTFFLVGVGATIIYDIFLSLRIAIKHFRFLELLEDFVFLFLCAVIVFVLFYQMNYGALRWYAFFGMLIGIMIYKLTVSPYFVRIMSTIMKKTIHLVFRVIKILLKPLKRSVYATSKIFHKGFIFLKKALKIAKSRLTVCIKRHTIKLCKQGWEGEHNSKEKKKKKITS